MIKIHYGWFVMIGCCMMLFLSLGLSSNLLGVFLNPIMEELGINKTAVSSILSVTMIMPMVSIMVINHTFDKFPVKWCIAVFVITMPVGMLILSQAQNLFQCYIAAGIIGFGVGGANMFTASYLLTNWFDQKRGFALGIASASTGLANMIMPPIIMALIAALELRNALVVYSGFMFLVAAIVLILVVERPSKKGMKPYGALPEGTEAEEALSGTDEGMADRLTLRDLMKMPKYWVLSLSMFVIGGSVFAFISHFVSFLNAEGCSMEQAAYIFSIYGFFMVIGKLLWGKLFDILGVMKGTIYVFIVWITGIGMGLFIGENYVISIIFAGVLGISSAIGTICLPIWINHIFDRHNYVSVFAGVAFIQTIGVALLVVFFGFVEDLTSSYKPAYFITLILTVLSFIGITACCRKRI